jgi:alpha-1,2-mannosyltransferase
VASPARVTLVRATPVPRGVVAVGLGAAVVLVGLFLAPFGPKMIDLDVYRAGAGALLHGGDVYAVAGPAGLPFTYPIFAALVFVPFALVPTVLARVAITLLSLGALLVICHRTIRGVVPAGDRGLLRWSVPAAIVAITAHPVLDTLLFGQVNLVLVAMVLTDVLVVRGPGRGVLVGLAAGTKLTPGLFVLYYLVIGDWRAARTAALTTAGTLLVGLALAPGSTWAYLTRYMLDPARTGNVTYAGNQSILAVTARLVRREHPPPVLTALITAVVVIVALVLARALHARGEELASVCVVAAAALLASPVSWTHHWVWFIPAVGVLAAWAHRGGAAWRWWVLGAATLVLWSGPMRFTPTNGLRELHDTLPQQLVANSYGLLAVGFLAWAAVRLARTRWAAGRPPGYGDDRELGTEKVKRLPE